MDMDMSIINKHWNSIFNIFLAAILDFIGHLVSIENKKCQKLIPWPQKQN